LSYAATPKPTWAEEDKADLDLIKAALRQILRNGGSTPDEKCRAAALLHQIITS
jgi:hypothetical protein